ncbi:MAG: hypothetical protein RL417_1773 [Pseudomonadota bacterium]|jgi:8-oxo-dGTP pyrophosphatase MutT (NUDIX family)
MLKINPAGWIIEDEHIYQAFKIFTLKRSRRVNPRTGKPFDFFLMEGLSWVNVIPLTSANEVVLVRQYRHGAEELTLEIPGGCIELDETDPASAALRELREETGFTTNEIEPLGIIHPNPAMMSMKLHTYVARNCTLSGIQVLDPGEDIEVILKPLAEVLDLVRSGQITHALVVAAFGLFALGQREG